MRTDSAAFAQKNVELAKDPRYVIVQAFDSANSVLWAFTSHDDAALPPGLTGSILGIVQGLSGTSQTLSPDTANASIGSINYNLVDRGGIVTSTLGGQIQLGRSTRKQRTQVYVGFQGLAWADYTLVQTQLVTKISFIGGAYKFSCADVQRQMRKDIFDQAKTNLTASVLAGDATINVVSTTGFSMVPHGSSYSDAPSATVGYIKIEDEVIRYTGKTATTYTGCTHGVLNTRAVDHLVDPTADEERRTPVTEYVYLELPAVKAMYALLTGALSGEAYLSLPGSSGNSATTPDSTANSITGDLDLRVKVSLRDWTQPVEPASFISKWPAAAAPGSNVAFLFAADTDGKLRFLWSTNGNGITGDVKSTVPTGFLDGSAHWVRVTIDVDNGAAGNDVKFYTSDNYDPSTGLGTWTQLGATVTTGGTTSIFDSPAAVQIGAIFTGATQWFAVGSNFYQAEMLDGIGGTRRVWFDPGLFAPGALTATMATSELWTVNQSGGTPAQVVNQLTLPSSWHLGIPPSYVRLADFKGIGADLWQPADDEQGFVTRFEDLKKTEGKKFIESELALLLGVFMPVYSDGALGLKRMSNILAGAAYVRQLDESNIVGSGGDLALDDDFDSLHNIVVIEWNWDPLQQKFTRPQAIIDQDSINVHQQGDPLVLKFRGLHGSRHSSAILKQRFDALRDRYSNPPLRLDVSVLPSLNTLEVGDVVRVRLANVRDFNAPGGGGSLDRSFEIQNVQTDWITGALKLKLFASSRAPGPIASTADATVLSSAWYTGTGTDLSTVLTITGSNPGHISASGNLAGNVDLNNAGAIYYYNGDLQLDAGVTVTINNNVQLRVKGFLQVNGKIDGKGRGIAGAQPASPPGIFDLNGSIAVKTAAASKHNDGTAGFIGITEAGGGISINVTSIRGAQVIGRNAVIPQFTLVWDGTTLSGLPADLRGSSGSSGMPVKYNPIDATQPWAMGAAGGPGGAGLIIVSRGIDLGASGKIDLSGGDGFAAAPSTFLTLSYFAGSGAGGAPGGLFNLLDGTAAVATDLTGPGFIAAYGRTPIPAAPLPTPGDNRVSVAPGSAFYSYYVGTGDGTTFPIPGAQPGGNLASLRVQYVPGNPLAAVDAKATDIELLLQEMQASNWTIRSNPKAVSLRAVTANASLFVAVGDADGGDAYILTSTDGTTWTERANPKNFGLFGIAWNGSIFVAVGVPDGGDAYIVTSPDGTTWTERANPKNFQLFSVTWNGSIFVAVGLPDGGDAYLITSPDGTTWTERANPKNVALIGVAWSAARGLFVAVGNQDGATDAYIVTSPDGITWTERANPKNTQLDAVVAIGGGFAAVGLFDGAVDAYIITSPDGITWTERANPNKSGLSGIASTGDLLVAGASFGGVFLTSRDFGANWIAREASGPVDTRAICWSGRRFVAVGTNDGTKALIYTSLAK